MDDVTIGYQVLNIFISYFNSKWGYNFTADQVASSFGKYPQNYIEGLGFMFRQVIDSDSSKLQKAMKNLSDASNGNLPKYSGFSYAFSQAEQDYSFFDAALYVTVETTKQIAGGVQQVGNTILATGDLLRVLFPFAVLGMGYLYYLHIRKKLDV